MADLNKVILCLENIKGKNLGQNPDNLSRFLIKDFGFEQEDADKLMLCYVMYSLFKVDS